MRLRLWLLVAATLVSSLMLSADAFAARVIQVKGKSVLIDLEGDSAEVGDKFFVMIDGKKKGLLTVTKVKNTRAVATLTKGKAEVDATAQAAKSGRSGGETKTAAKGSRGKKRASRATGKSWGLLGGYSMNSQTAKLIDPTRTQTIDVAMSGSGFNLLGFMDIPYSGNLGFTGRGGVEMFAVEGLAAQPYCSGNTANCKTEITYLTLDALLRYNLGSGGFVPWVGGGLGIYYPLSTSTTALNPDIGMSTVFLIDGGFNYHLSGGSYIPVVAQYALFPPGPDVSTSIISVRVGYGMSF